MIPIRLETRYPTHQNAIDLFQDRWLTQLEVLYPELKSGPGRYYLRNDKRPVQAADHLGFVPGSLHGMKVLELGPMEGAHTYQLAKLGADSILAIEANSDAYLRCLVAKEILRTPNCRFLLGDFLAFLEQSEERFDLIFCSGVLYHMADPARLLAAISKRTDRVFLWTHYFDPLDPRGPTSQPQRVRREGVDITYHEQTYDLDLQNRTHWGGVAPSSAWMERDEILRICEQLGFSPKVLDDNRDLPMGHQLTAVFSRQTGAAA
jgi:SAM-dependent methyltransferase